MIPRTFPSVTVDGVTCCVVSVITPTVNQQAWIDYIPVKSEDVISAKVNRYDTDGAIAGSVLDDITGKAAWSDYIPVALVDNSVVHAWTTNALGYIPVKALQGVFATAPTLDLDFLNAGLDPRITFTRASNATLIGADGTLQYAPHNLLLQSQSLTTTPWEIGANLTSNGQDGTLDGVAAWRFTSNGTSNSYVRQTVAGLVPGATYTASFLCNVDGGGGAYLRINGPNTQPSFVVTQVSAGLFRYSLTFVFPASGATSVTIHAGRVDAPASTVFRTTAAQLNIGTLQPYYPTTTAAYYGPRFDHDPVTLAPRGLLIEEQRTNSIRNNTMQGAVAGTPGTLPTNWVGNATPNGLSREIVGTGISNGISYIDVKYSGTTTSAAFVNFLLPENNVSIAASNGQAWTVSVYAALVGGSFANVTGFTCRVRFNDSIGTELSQAPISLLTATSDLRRFAVSLTASNASTAFVSNNFSLQYASGVAINFTLRIGLPQLELGAFATSAIPTFGAAATRAADVAVMTGANFSSWYNQSEGALFAEYSVNATGYSAGVVAISDGSLNNRMIIRGMTPSNTAGVIGVSGGVTQWNMGFTSQTTDITRVAFAYKTDDIAATRNGATPSTDSLAVIPTLDRLRLGVDGDGSLQTNGHIRRIAYYPRRLSNAQLQALTAEMQGAWLFNNPAQSGNLLTSGLI